jgi:hypothetical protein
VSETLHVEHLLPPPYNDALCDRGVSREAATGAGGEFGGSHGGGRNTGCRRKEGRCLSMEHERNPFLRRLGCAVPDSLQSDMLAT